MTSLKRYLIVALSLYMTISVSLVPIISLRTLSTTSESVLTSSDEDTYASNFSTNEGSYEAELNWVRTILRLNSDGTGEVTIFVNCTPTEDHFGIYIRPLVSNEEVSVISDETYAINHGQILEVNYTVDLSESVAHRIFIKTPSSLYTNETILYKFSYEADFFLSEQIILYKNDPLFVVADLERPYWEGDLEFEELVIILPIDVGQSNVTSGFLDEIKFSTDTYTSSYYILSYSTEASGSGDFWFVFTCRKNNLGDSAPFEVRFYLDKSVFSLPKAFNWVVILLVSFLTVLSLSLFIIVINVKNKSEKEVKDFKDELFTLLKEVNEKEESPNSTK